LPKCLLAVFAKSSLLGRKYPIDSVILKFTRHDVKQY
jgi:hypothetical protein